MRYHEIPYKKTSYSSSILYQHQYPQLLPVAGGNWKSPGRRMECWSPRRLRALGCSDFSCGWSFLKTPESIKISLWVVRAISDVWVLQCVVTYILAAAPPTVVYLPDTVGELFSSVRFWSRRLLNITSMGIYGNALGAVSCAWGSDLGFNDLRLAQQHGEWHNFRLKARPSGWGGQMMGPDFRDFRSINSVQSSQLGIFDGIFIWFDKGSGALEIALRPMPVFMICRWINPAWLGMLGPTLGHPSWAAEVSRDHARPGEWTHVLQHFAGAVRAFGLAMVQDGPGWSKVSGRFGEAAKGRAVWLDAIGRSCNF